MISNQSEKAATHEMRRARSRGGRFENSNRGGQKERKVVKERKKKGCQPKRFVIYNPHAASHPVATGTPVELSKSSGSSQANKWGFTAQSRQRLVSWALEFGADRFMRIKLDQSVLLAIPSRAARRVWVSGFSHRSNVVSKLEIGKR